MLKPLTDADSGAVERLLDTAFGPARRERTAYRVRDGVEPIAELCYAAFADDVLLGTIQCWPVALTPQHGEAIGMVMVGPVAVLPERIGEGIGKMMLARIVGAFDRDGGRPAMLIGDPDYYGLFGFVSGRCEGWRLPGPVEPHRILLRAAEALAIPDAGHLGPWRGGEGSPH